MSEFNFIPCEICDELILFENYNDHTDTCNSSFSLPMPNVRTILLPLSRIQRPQPQQPQQPQPQPQSQPQQPQQPPLQTSY